MVRSEVGLILLLFLLCAEAVPADVLSGLWGISTYNSRVILMALPPRELPWAGTKSSLTQLMSML